MSVPVEGADAAEAAGRAQRLASDPMVSAFVSASAGSGKTKLLIDRLLRLMLPGHDRIATPPERILCLTFTKAGAAEMAIRLRRALGDWVVLDDAALDARLARLDLPTTPKLRDAARALFATVLDMPGGLRIGTIHAFCEQLLRRFPLEAAISPHFRLVEETDGMLALGLARESAIGLEASAGAVVHLASRLNALQHGQMTTRLQAKAERLAHAHGLPAADLASALREALAIADADEAALDAEEATGMDGPALRAALALIVEEGAAGVAQKAARILELLNGDAGAGAARIADWFEAFVTGGGEPRQIVQARWSIARAHPHLAATLAAESERLIGIDHRRRALALVEATASLLALSGPALAAYAGHKAARGLVDFDDLIGRTRMLLRDPGVAWILFKLDGGLDHLLLDEVQDTSDAQWQIAGALTEEFFTGQGANPSPRTVFAVGDFKQSIYSFQGADPEAFLRWRDIFRARAAQAGAAFAEPALNVSFRSAPAILRFVDAVFRPDGSGEDAAVGVVEPGAVLAHASARGCAAGRVEIWPLARRPMAPEPASPWEAGVDGDARSEAAGGEQRVADALAGHLAELIAAGSLRPGDILVLVRRRQGFAPALMRALKARDVPVAGLDRMVLTEQPAVQDLLALCDALLLPDDDLAFATMLTSPLGGLDDAGLMALALGRGNVSLRETLARRQSERADWAAAHAFFDPRFRRADFVDPHALLVDVLGDGGGRARFLGRLGPEASDAIDELLEAALTHAASHPPSLQQFVHWLRRSGAEVKREAGGPHATGPGEVRLMTVHGSKGLEAPLVVLADTTSLPALRRDLLWTAPVSTASVAGPGGEATTLPIWVPERALSCRSVAAFEAEEEQRSFCEYNRLLYVALTRARDRLLICGWESRSLSARCWYAHCRKALAGMDGVARIAMPAREDAGAAGDAGWDGDRLVLDEAATGPVTVVAEPSLHAALALPAWMGSAPSWHQAAPPPEPMPPRRLAPSQPEGVAWGPQPAASSPRSAPGRAQGRLRGRILHALLQHLPGIPASMRREAAMRFAHARLDATLADALADEALAVIADPLLARVFGPEGRAEQPLAGLVHGLAVTGVVDRLAIGPDFVDLVEFKSGRTPPASPDATPVAYLRQMAAYRAVLQALRPQAPVRCMLVWTASATVIALDDGLLDLHAPHAPRAPRAA